MRWPRTVVSLIAWLLAAAISASAGSDRVRLVPRLQPGQTIVYLVSYESHRNIKTESRVALQNLPTDAKVEAHGLLLVDVLEKGADGALRLKTHFAALSSDTKLGKPGEKVQPGDWTREPAAARAVELTLMPDGNAANLSGLEKLFPEQQDAWRVWLASFAAGMVFPKNGVKLGEKWDREEAETSPAPIAQLFWSQKTQYVRDEPCDGVQLSVTGEELEPAKKADTCAVSLTTSRLVQKSSQKDATPESFKLRDLKTKGAARGSNETILFFSKSTGLLVRATEDAEQTMDVLVASADGSNQVHYNVDARSHARIVLVTDSALAKP